MRKQCWNLKKYIKKVMLKNLFVKKKNYALGWSTCTLHWQQPSWSPSRSGGWIYSSSSRRRSCQGQHSTSRNINSLLSDYPFFLQCWRFALVSIRIRIELVIQSGTLDKFFYYPFFVFCIFVDPHWFQYEQNILQVVIGQKTYLRRYKQNPFWKDFGQFPCFRIWIRIPNIDQMPIHAEPDPQHQFLL